MSLVTVETSVVELRRVSTYRTYLTGALRIGVPLAIIGVLLWRLDREQLRQLMQQPIRWQWLVLGFACSFLAVCLSFYRWYCLVRCLNLPFRLRDAFRLGFLGYLLNFVAVGSVGGDVFKAIFIAREHPGRRTLAVTSVIVDRLVGMYALLLLAAGAMLVTTIESRAPELQTIRRLTWSVAGVGTVFGIVVLSANFTTTWLAEWMASLPKVGGVLYRLTEAVRCYRRSRGILLSMVLLGVIIHGLSAIAFFFLACGLSPLAPSFQEHLIIVPLASVAGALPFTPAGLGTFELAMQVLYERVPESPGLPGILVALAYRLVTISSAMIGAVIYWANQREVAEAARTGSIS